MRTEPPLLRRQVLSKHRQPLNSTIQQLQAGNKPRSGHCNCSHLLPDEFLHGSLRKHAYCSSSWDGTERILHIPGRRTQWIWCHLLPTSFDCRLRRGTYLRRIIYPRTQTMARSNYPSKSQDRKWSWNRSLPRSHRTHLRRWNRCNNWRRRYQRTHSPSRLSTLTHRSRDRSLLIPQDAQPNSLARCLRRRHPHRIPDDVSSQRRHHRRDPLRINHLLAPRHVHNSIPTQRRWRLLILLLQEDSNFPPHQPHPRRPRLGHHRLERRPIRHRTRHVPVRRYPRLHRDIVLHGSLLRRYGRRHTGFRRQRGSLPRRRNGHHNRIPLRLPARNSLHRIRRRHL